MVMTRQVISSGGHDGGGAAAAADGRLAVEDEGAASGGILGAASASGHPLSRYWLKIGNFCNFILSLFGFHQEYPSRNLEKSRNCSEI